METPLPHIGHGQCARVCSPASAVIDCPVGEATRAGRCTSAQTPARQVATNGATDLRDTTFHRQQSRAAVRVSAVRDVVADALVRQRQLVVNDADGWAQLLRETRRQQPEAMVALHALHGMVQPTQRLGQSYRVGREPS